MRNTLKSKVIKVLLKKEGVYFGEFAALFHQVHGYGFKLTNYGYKSLKDLLDDMKDEVELLKMNGQLVIKYRPACQLNVISHCMDTSSQNNDPDTSDTCRASSNICWPQTDHLFTSRDNHTQPITSHENSTPTVVDEVNPSKQKSLHSKQKLKIPMISRPQNGHQGLRPNVSYAAVCAGNLKKDKKNLPSLECPPNLNVQNVHTANPTPTCKEAPKDHLFTSRDNHMEPISFDDNSTPTMVDEVDPSNSKQKLTIPTINRPQNGHQGLRPNVSYAAVCAGNLKKEQKNVPSLECPKNFNVQNVFAVNPTSTCKEAPQSILPGSMFRDNLQLLLKSYANGISIIQLQKLYLFDFKEPFLSQGLSARKLLMAMKDVAKIKGIGVQMKVFPELPEVDPSAKKYKDSTPQGAAISVAKDENKNYVLPHLQVLGPLSINHRMKHVKHCVLVDLSKRQASSTERSQTELTGENVPVSSSEDITSHQHHDRTQPMTEDFGRILPTPAVLHPVNNPSVMGSQLYKMNESPSPDGMARNLSCFQCPLLPKNGNILKESYQEAKMSNQLLKNIQHNELCFRQYPTVASQPQEKENSAQTLLHADQDPYKIDGKINYRQQKPQTLDLAHPIPQSDFYFVMEQAGFSFVKAKTKVVQDKNNLKIVFTCPPSNRSADVAQLALQLNQSASSNMKSQIKGSAPEANIKPVNVPAQQKTFHYSYLMQPLCSGEPSKEQWEASSPKNIYNFDQRGSTPSPSKQAVAYSNLNNRCGLAVSPEPQSPEEVSNSQTKVGSHDICKEQSLGAQTTSNVVEEVSSSPTTHHDSDGAIPWFTKNLTLQPYQNFLYSLRSALTGYSITSFDQQDSSDDSSEESSETRQTDSNDTFCCIL